MYCKKCGAYNSNDSLRCKKCGDYLVNQYLNDDLDIYNDYNNEQKYNKNSTDNKKSNSNNNTNKSNSKKSKNKKTSSSKKKKSKKDKNGFFNKNRKTDNKEKSRRNISKNDKEGVVKNGCFANGVIIFLVIFIFILMAICGFLGIYILNDKFIKVPDVVGLSEKDASKVLDDNGISYVIKEEKTTDTNEFGVVTSQDKEAGKYILKSSTIAITIGSDDDSNNSNTNNNDNNDTIILDNLVGKTKEEATNILDNNNINYDIVEIESSEEDGIVVKQSISAGEVITDDTILTIYISKHVDSYDDNNVTNNTDTSTLDDNNTNNN